MAVQYNEATGDYEWINDQESTSTNDGSAGESNASDNVQEAVDSGSYWGNSSGDNSGSGLLSFINGGYEQDASSGSSAFLNHQRASPTEMAQYLSNTTKESTGLTGDFVDAALGKVDEISKWIGANPKTSEFLFKTVGGIWAATEARKAAEANGRNRIEEQNNQARLEQEKVQRYNDSFSGKLPTSNGLINKHLTRKDGSRVWDSSGKLTKAA